MMRRLREIPCRMLARTAVQPRVLVALKFDYSMRDDGNSGRRRRQF